jgi:hypothetical protein
VSAEVYVRVRTRGKARCLGGIGGWVHHVGGPRAVREGIHQHLDVLQFRREPCSHHIVGARHALEDLPRQVGVRLVRAHEKGLPGLELQHVEEERRHRAGVPRVLPSQAGHDPLHKVIRALESPHKSLEGGGGGGLRTCHEGGEEALEGSFHRGRVGRGGVHGSSGLGGHALGELGVFGEVRGDFLDGTEAAHGLGGESTRGDDGVCSAPQGRRRSR